MSLRSSIPLFVIVLLPAFALAGVPKATDDDAGSIGERRARWFLNRDTVTSVIEERRLITQVTPWSCVVVEPSLPPCRHVRQLDINLARTVPVLSTAAPVVPVSAEDSDGDNVLGSATSWRQGRAYDDRWRSHQRLSASMDNDYYATPPLSGSWVSGNEFAARDVPGAVAAPITGSGPSPVPIPAPQPNAAPTQQPGSVITQTAVHPASEMGWAEWLGLAGHTVTTTLVKYETTKFVDPDTVVTFSVRGCQPSKLPFDLPLCNDPAVSPQVHSATAPVGSNKAAPAVEVNPSGSQIASPASPPPINASAVAAS